jgi:hypothetical protein
MPDSEHPERPEARRSQDRQDHEAGGGKAPVLEATEARQAVKLGTMRYVLLASLILAVILMAVVGAVWHAAS